LRLLIVDKEAQKENNLEKSNKRGREARTDVALKTIIRRKSEEIKILKKNLARD
jgi:hypothetical protein